MLSSVGLQNPGIGAWLGEDLPAPGQSGGEGGGERVGPERGRLCRGPRRRLVEALASASARGRSWQEAAFNISCPNLEDPRRPDVLSLRGGDEALSRGRIGQRPGTLPACRSWSQVEPQRH